jgi:hypothetical protein
MRQKREKEEEEKAFRGECESDKYYFSDSHWRRGALKCESEK